MKTVLYYNVTTGEVFDADGSPRSLNNPFTAAYGEKRLFEWHLVTEVSGSDPEGWMPLSEFEVDPGIASLAADDTYVNAYPGRVESIETGSEESLLRIRLDSEDAVIPGRSRIRVQRTDGEFLEVEYTAVTEEGGVPEFHIPEDLSAEGVLSGGKAEVVKQPMAKSSSMLSGSDPSRGVFQFSLTFQSEKLKNLFEYSDLEASATRGLELRLAGVDGTGERVELVRAVAPLTILGVLDQSTLPAAVSEPEFNELQDWTLALLREGLEVAFSRDGNSWTTDSTGALYFRLRPSNIPDAQWCTAIPIPQPKLDPDHVEYSFSVLEGSGVETVEIPYSELKVSKPFDSSLFELQSDGSELNITHNANVQMFYTSSLVRICWNGTFPAGTYILRG